MIYLRLDLNCVSLLEVQLSVSVCMSSSSLQLVWVVIFRAIYLKKNNLCTDSKLHGYSPFLFKRYCRYFNESLI